MKKYLIYGVVIATASFLAVDFNKDAGVFVALLGGLFTTIKALGSLKAEQSNHIDTAEEVASLTILNKKYEAMIDRIQIDNKHLKETINGYHEASKKESELTEALKELPEVKEPVKKTRKTAVKKTK